jgi:hypothetical protein
MSAPPKFFDPPPPEDALIFWVIYCAPIDAPTPGYVVRPQYAQAGKIICSDLAGVAPTLEAARDLIPGCAGLYCQPRAESDDPVIVECWF